ncbi:Insulin-induced [Botryosphaeria dothidea]|uniref:Insulin-induced n=1 Tax=Botryosphaeria dothidea TaxID=55169 RepID=A0A8H4N3Y3_9PEZI|nr:Insulin-induced [Botryosphaeria dothidea]KAF4312067.1 Insulin-induced [Botryosphaeria dothidea]
MPSDSRNTTTDDFYGDQPHTLHTTSQPPPQILRPLPRRPFELNLTPATSSSSANSSQPSPNPNNHANRDAFSAQLDARLSSTNVSRSFTPGSSAAQDDGEDVKRSRSILNLTASTLFGIYQPTASGGGAEASEPPTPWGTGAETPAYGTGSGIGGAFGSSSELREWEQLRLAGLGTRHAAEPVSSSPRREVSSGDKGRFEVYSSSSADKRRASDASAIVDKGGNRVLGLVARVVALFGFGVVYGVMISHLHDNRHIAPVRVDGIDRRHWDYLVFWGLAGVALGSALPWVDLIWEGESAAASAKSKDGRRVRAKGQVLGAAGGRSRDDAGQDWNEVVRSVGAFVGIAFAIRKLPWQSTLQVSLTLALVNPALWYLLDRSKPGFTLSMLVGLTGTAIMLLLGQHADSVAFIPSPPIVGGTGPNSSVRLGARGGRVGAEGIGGGAESDYESTVGVATWFASVLFCSCVCFGNIGRKLAIQG